MIGNQYYLAYLKTKTIITMKTLKLEDSTARSIYKTADESLKLILEENFGKDFFKTELKDRINNFEDICTELDITNLKINMFSYLPKDQQESALLEFQIKSIVSLVNKGKTFGTYRYYPYLIKGGLGWSVSYFIIGYGSNVGSGFYYTSREDCLYWTNKFLSIYSKWMERK